MNVRLITKKSRQIFYELVQITFLTSFTSFILLTVFQQLAAKNLANIVVKAETDPEDNRDSTAWRSVPVFDEHNIVNGAVLHSSTSDRPLAGGVELITNKAATDDDSESSIPAVNRLMNSSDDTELQNQNPKFESTTAHDTILDNTGPESSSSSQSSLPFDSILSSTQSPSSPASGSPPAAPLSPSEQQQNDGNNGSVPDSSVPSQSPASLVGNFTYQQAATLPSNASHSREAETNSTEPEPTILTTPVVVDDLLKDRIHLHDHHGHDDAVRGQHNQQQQHQHLKFPHQQQKQAEHIHRKNYAARECGAKVLLANDEVENKGAILNDPERDDYMRNPCKLSNKFLVIELCETVQPTSLELANFELFSSSPREFRLYGSERYPTHEWTLLGEFLAKDIRQIQRFSIPEQPAYAKFVKVDLLTHYGREHYCTLSTFRLYGISMVDEYEAEATSLLAATPAPVASSTISQQSQPVNSSASPPPSLSSPTPLTVGQRLFLARFLNDSAKPPRHPYCLPLASNSKDASPEFHNEGAITISTEPELTVTTDTPGIVDDDIDDFVQQQQIPPPDTSATQTPLPSSVDSEKQPFTPSINQSTQEKQQPLHLNQIFAQPVPTSTDKIQVIDSEKQQQKQQKRQNGTQKTQPIITAAPASEKTAETLTVKTVPSKETSSETRPPPVASDSAATHTLPSSHFSLPEQKQSSKTNDNHNINIQPQHHYPNQQNQQKSQSQPQFKQQHHSHQQPITPEIVLDKGNQQSPLPGTSSTHKESVFMKLNKRLAAIEINMSLGNEFLQELSRRYVTQNEEMLRLNETVTKLAAMVVLSTHHSSSMNEADQQKTWSGESIEDGIKLQKHEQTQNDELKKQINQLQSDMDQMRQKLKQVVSLVNEFVFGSSRFSSSDARQKDTGDNDGHQNDGKQTTRDNQKQNPQCYGPSAASTTSLRTTKTGLAPSRAMDNRLVFSPMASNNYNCPRTASEYNGDESSGIVGFVITATSSSPMSISSLLAMLLRTPLHAWTMGQLLAVVFGAQLLALIVYRFALLVCWLIVRCASTVLSAALLATIRWASNNGQRKIAEKSTATVNSD